VATKLEKDVKSRNQKLVWGAILLVACGGLVYLATIYGFMAGMGAAILGIAGLSVFAGALLAFQGCGPCPKCGALLSDVPRDLDGVFCSGCSDYLVVKDGVVDVTQEDRVASAPTYPIRVEGGTQPALPGLCLACGQAATQEVERELSATVIGAPGVGRIVKKWTAALPFCAEHAALDELGNPTGLISVGAELRITSYRAWRSAVEAGLAGAPLHQ